jgi:hypothetical protein
MAGKTPRLYLEHIREAMGLIDRYAGGRQRQDLDRDPMLRRALERNLEIIAEASRRLPATMKARHPDVPRRDIAAIGNIPPARIRRGQSRHRLADRDPGHSAARDRDRGAPGPSVAQSESVTAVTAGQRSARHPGSARRRPGTRDRLVEVF